MRFRFFGLLVVIATLLSGCQTVPYYSTQKQFSPPPADGKGRVLISSFQIPKRGIGDFIGLLFKRSDTNYNDRTSIYDMTNGATYIGTLLTDGEGSGAWLEHDANPGQHLLMLTRNVFAYFPNESQEALHVDFIEIGVSPGVTNHVAISQYGVMRNPFFGRIKIEDKHREACSRLSEVEPGAFGRAINAAIEAYMTQSGIPLEATDFKYYCRSLARPIVHKPNATGLLEFGKAKSVIEATRDKNYDNWEIEARKTIAEPYDIMKTIEKNSWADK